ncbi:hypothetical protein [Bacillus sp. OV322]|uniref:hypothetical protein n=1 Tax=Bacillus sp. OV322 TaxID=1882764 RepID=UPI0015A544D5|nr:hypothetical protein [Bacillus sp. OV322]
MPEELTNGFFSFDEISPLTPCFKIKVILLEVMKLLSKHNSIQRDRPKLFLKIVVF